MHVEVHGIYGLFAVIKLGIENRGISQLLLLTTNILVSWHPLLSVSRCSVGHQVALHVRFQAVALSESLIAEFTLVRSLPVVGSHVDFQIRFTSARFPTSHANKRFEA